MHNLTEITEKNYKKLSIQVGLDGFSFCVFDLLSSKVLSFKKVAFFSFKDSNKLENAANLLLDNFNSNSELQECYDEILVIYSNNLSTFVPHALFDEDYLGSYLQYNTKVFETDFFAFDIIENYEMNNVFIPFINFNNLFIEKFGSFDYVHASTILVTKLLDLSKNTDAKKMYVQINKSTLDLVVVQKQKLVLYNSFDYKTPDDLLYYILFTAEQLDLNPEVFSLQLFGNVHIEDDFYKLCYNYIRNVSILNVNFMRSKNDFTETVNRENFILFNS